MDITEVRKRQDLSGLDLSSYSLGGMDLSGRNFRGADLSHAHLGNANLAGADLRNALLCNANLGAANLTGADLRFADLRGANLAGVILMGADLRDTIGLDQTAHASIASFIRPVSLEETEDFVDARENGYFPLSHWGESYTLPNGKTLCKSETLWGKVKGQLGDHIFGDRRIFSEVRLVQQYKHYRQWAYMISRRGFEQIARGLGMKLKPKKQEG